MELPHQIAADVSRLFKAASESCESSLRVIMAHQSLGEAMVYESLVAIFMGHVFTNVLRPIWQKSPDIEPEEMKKPYVETSAQLAPESSAALKVIAVVANEALQYARRGVPQEQQSASFDFEGLTEIEKALSKISSFIEQPHFR
jgi:hypothetical protein